MSLTPDHFVQVTPEKVLLLRDSELVQTVELTEMAGITQAVCQVSVMGGVLY